MKSLRPLLIILVIIGLIVTLFLTLAQKQNMVTVFEGNVAQKPIPMTLNHYQDAECGMVIDELNYASQVVSADGKTWFFHDHGGMVKWLEERSFKDEAVIWVYGLKSKKWIDGRKAFYTRDEETPMFYGFGAYRDYKKNRITFKKMQEYTLRGETMINPSIKKLLLERKEQIKKEQNGNH